MPIDEVATLRAAGLEAAAKVIEAARAGQVAAQPPATPEAPAVTPAAAPAPAPEIPAAAVPAQAVAAAQRPGPQPPAGKAPLQTIDEWEALPKEERLARVDEVDALILEGQK